VQLAGTLNKLTKSNPILSSDKQLELVRRWQKASDKQSLDVLILSNIKCVLKEASRIKRINSYISYEDLIQEGVAGLLKAADMFDEAKGVMFLTYAMWWVRANMKRYVMDYRSVVKMGTTRADRAIFNNLSKATKEVIRLGLSEEEGSKKIAEIIGVSIEQLGQMRASLRGFDDRLDLPVGRNDNDILKVNLLEDPASLEDVVLNQSEDSYVFNALREITEELPSDEKNVIEQRYFAQAPKTLRVLAKEMNVSREWVRKIEIKALDRIRKRLANNYELRSCF